ncbi:hypothetical protein [Pseudomonas fluorescens]|uniref:hypothetical protein n=1 Tax=Pseudomonas fluorescens TaxID=294 RepID=UPI003D089F46
MTAQEDAPKIRSDFPETPEKPGIRPAPVDNKLDPMLVHNGGVKQLKAEIERSAQGFRAADGVVVELKGWNDDEKRGSYISNEGKPLPFGAANLRVLNLDPEVVAFNLDQMIEVKYTAYRDGEDPVTSEVLELKVLDIPPEELKAGVIFGKNDDGTGPVLDLTTDTDDRTARIDIWALIAVGQWLWIVLTGEDENGDPYELTLFKGLVDQDLITLRYIDVIVLFSELKLFGDGTDATLQYKVAFDQVEDESKANLSEVRSYTVKNNVAVNPVISEVTDSKGVPVDDNGETTDTTLKLTIKAGANEELEFFVNDDSKGKFPANDQGDLTHPLTGLEPGEQVLKVVGVVSGRPSNIWTVTIKAVVKDPVITKVTDSRDEPVDDNGETTDTTLKLTIKAGAEEELEFFVNDDSKGKFPANDQGDLTHPLTGLEPGEQVLKVVGVASGRPSNIWTVTVQPVETEKPVIESAKDSSNSDVPHESITEATTLDLTIKAGKFEQLRILLNGVPGDQAPANGDGVLHYRLAGLKPGDQNITVMGITSELVSDTYNVFVVAGPSDGKLAIIAAKDAQHNQVLRGGAMNTTTITLTGTAQPSARVTISDVVTVLRTVVADLNGYWRLTLDDLKVHYYHLALSAEGAEPPMLWWLAVFAVGTPIIERVTDLTGTTLIPPYGEISEAAFTVYGDGPANGRLTLHELLSDVSTPVTVDAYGKWQHTQHATAGSREYHYVTSVPGGGTPKSNLYRVRKVASAK